ncbi:hypothetical protein DTO027B5_3306 [Paecilomyces variotii]|nr:hypothetical protein DTO195F2_3464 [Paecilomyces variotii]KAJ9310051.1 hypothetical protein DTO217A2_337 [Paecilomyces variotii]KAJ9324871.1 hypothetical protein DTO027B3_4003 [Paecilomyces variotii]KAJ9334800.1 hypothetical protein DTO027B5_3306 [Paecilomyces variotii]KAJ9375196.1 hypothetical protein DTO282E5_180 [Paecilomyces variotii]
MAEASGSSKVMPANRAPGAPGVIRSSTIPLAPSDGSRTASPDVERPGSIRASQTFPIVSSHGTSSQQGTRRSHGIPFAKSSVTESGADGQSAIDPLSQHILRRTTTEKLIPLRVRAQTSHEAEAGGTDAASNLGLSEQASTRGEVAASLKSSKDKKKGVSFLSRLIPNKKKDQISDSNDSQSELDDERMDTEVFAYPIGFIPRFPPPPKYIKVRLHNKKQKTFDHVFVAQELKGFDEPNGRSNRGATTERAIWTLEFSKDGKYLAAAGQDRKIRVWAVIANSEARRDHELDEEKEDEGEGPSLRLTAPVFKSTPIQEYEGHTGSILDLCWSKNNFLLSSSMDKTVRLWHVSRSECLCCFKHSDFVTSIKFHPRDDRFFLAGSLDCKLRLWSIPDKSVAFWATVPEMITAVAFTPDGKSSIAGCLNGLCLLYDTDGLKANGQIHVRSARGRNAKGSKITGIDTIVQPPNDSNGEVKLLITSNDSRIRLYNFKDRTLEAKFRGNENNSSQIRASFSDDGKYVICGSEDRRTYIWPTGWNDKETDKRAVEVFETQSSIVTAVVMAPTKTKQLLGLSGDPIYDLCNPPPITLGPQPDSRISSRSKTDSGALRDDFAPGSGKTESLHTTKALESPTYLSRSAHSDGNIIVAADYSGRIKVFRQDCAYQKRRSESWETNSTFSRKILGRTNSARHSIASSIGKESKTPSERIISWRDSVIGTEISSIDNPRNAGGLRTRSSSPRKAMAHLSRYSSPIAAPTAVVPESPSASAHSPPPSAPKSSMDSPSSSTMDAARSFHTAETDPSSPQHPERPLEGPSVLMDGTQSHAYWNKTAQAAQAASARRTANTLDPHFLSPAARQYSVASALSSDCSSLTGEQEEGEILRCTDCKGTNFRATRTREGKPRLICVKCNKPAT